MKLSRRLISAVTAAGMAVSALPVTVLGEGDSGVIKVDDTLIIKTMNFGDVDLAGGEKVKIADLANGTDEATQYGNLDVALTFDATGLDQLLNEGEEITWYEINAAIVKDGITYNVSTGYRYATAPEGLELSPEQLLVWQGDNVFSTHISLPVCAPSAQQLYAEDCYASGLKDGDEVTVSVIANTVNGYDYRFIAGQGVTAKVTDTNRYKELVVEKPAPERTVTSVKLSSNSFTYNGKVQKPAVTVAGREDGKAITLKEGEDYKVSYSHANSTNARTYSVTVKGINGCKGVGKASYTIAPAKITAVELSNNMFVYNGKVQKPTVKSVKAGNMTVPASGYTVKCSNTKNVGNYNVNVVGKGNFTGDRIEKYSITKTKNEVKVAKTKVNKSFKVSALKKDKAITLPKVTAKFGKAKWIVKKKYSKGRLVLKGQKLYILKDTPEGKYKITLYAKVKSTKNYKEAKSKNVTVTVIVK